MDKAGVIVCTIYSVTLYARMITMVIVSVERLFVLLPCAIMIAGIGNYG